MGTKKSLCKAQFLCLDPPWIIYITVHSRTVITEKSMPYIPNEIDNQNSKSSLCYFLLSFSMQIYHVFKAKYLAWLRSMNLNLYIVFRGKARSKNMWWALVLKAPYEMKLQLLYLNTFIFPIWNRMYRKMANVIHCEEANSLCR